MDRTSERPALPRRRPLGIVFLNEHREHTARISKNQLAVGLRNLRHLRRDADSWLADGAVDLPPQPDAYGLRLGALLATEVWRRQP
jgi:hypothetical protein